MMLLTWRTLRTSTIVYENNRLLRVKHRAPVTHIWKTRRFQNKPYTENMTGLKRWFEDINRLKQITRYWKSATPSLSSKSFVVKNVRTVSDDGRWSTETLKTHSLYKTNFCWLVSEKSQFRKPSLIYITTKYIGNLICIWCSLVKIWISAVWRHFNV